MTWRQFHAAISCRNRPGGAKAMLKPVMSELRSSLSRINLSFAIALAVAASAAAAAEVSPPDVRGTWKGDSETILLGSGNPHHVAGQQAAAPELRSVPFTLVIDQQDGRRFSGTFSSPRRDTGRNPR
jgi:hypothetical protein